MQTQSQTPGAKKFPQDMQDKAHKGDGISPIDGVALRSSLMETNSVTGSMGQQQLPTIASQSTVASINSPSDPVFSAQLLQKGSHSSSTTPANLDPKRFWPGKEGASLQDFTTRIPEDDRDSVSSSNTSHIDESDPEMAYFASPGFPESLQRHGSFMLEFSGGITDESQTLCNTLLIQAQPVPDDTAFQPERLYKFEEGLGSMNEPMVSRELAQLVIPSLTSLILRGAQQLEALTETADDLWGSSVPLLGHRPKPDYSLGFDWSAFTPAQCAKLEHFDVSFTNAKAETERGSYSMATTKMYFPFFTCEVKRTAGDLDIADRQNTQSATIGLRGLVRLLRAANREMEVHRQAFYFSISHNDREVSIYGHYPVIQGENTYYYRHKISRYLIFEDSGKHRWQSHMFVKNLHEVFAPVLRNLICSAIDSLAGED